MTLALLVPNDYRRAAVLVRIMPDGSIKHDVSDRAELLSMFSVAESGGQMLRLHHDDQTPVAPRSRRSPHSDY